MTDLQRALSAYRVGANLAAAPQQVLYLLHDEAARALNSAKFAYQQNALDQTCRHLERAQRIIGGLLGHLRFEDAGTEGLRLKMLYLRLTRHLLRVFSDSDVAENLSDCAVVLQALRDGDAKEIDVLRLKVR